MSKLQGRYAALRRKLAKPESAQKLQGEVFAALRELEETTTWARTATSGLGQSVVENSRTLDEFDNLISQIAISSSGHEDAARSPSHRPVDSLCLEWDYPTMIVTLDSKRRLTVAASLAPATPGDCFDAQFDADEDTIIFRRIKRKANWLEVWKKCPVPMDDLPLRSRELPKKAKL